MSPLKKGDILELDIQDLAFGGRGVSRLEDFVWFVDGGIPGQKVKAIVRRKRSRFGEASLKEVLKPSPHEVPPPCPYFGVCGGCTLQQLDYPIQVKAKNRQLEEILRRIGGLVPGLFLDPVPADRLYGYRNKMEFTFSPFRWRMHPGDPEEPDDFALGLHVPGRFDKVIDIDACLLQPDIMNQIMRRIRTLCRESGLKAYHFREHTGVWRFLVLRHSRRNEIMVNLVTSGEEKGPGGKIVTGIAEILTGEIPEITTFVHSITDSPAQSSFGESARVLHGPGKILETLGGKQFEISPESFFQTNAYQADRLFQSIADLAALEGSETLFDLYCGTGAIGIYLSGKVRKIIGLEVIPQAVEDGRRNIVLNRLDNMEILPADMKDVLHDPDFMPRHGEPDIVILDPPRGGTHPRTIEDLIRLSCPKVVYVSCNPAILARDLKSFTSGGYTVRKVQMIDMFPHSGHIEAVALITRGSS